MVTVAPSEPPAPNVMSEPLLQGAPAESHATTPQGPETISCLIPFSPCPQLAFDSRIQSVDLYATAPHILEASNRCGWCPCCSGTSRSPFDWIGHLHCAASTLATTNPEEGPDSSSPAAPGSGRDCSHRNPHTLSQPPSGSEQQQALQIVQSLRGGAIPVGARAELSTLVGHNQLVFGGVKEINAAYSNAWLCIYACMVFTFFLPPLGWVLLFLVTVSSTVRRTLDEYVLYWMSQACSRVNVLLYTSGVALMLLEGASQDGSVSPIGDTSVNDVEVAELSRGSPGEKAWVLRIFLLPVAPVPYPNHRAEVPARRPATEPTTEAATSQPETLEGRKSLEER